MKFKFESTDPESGAVTLHEFKAGTWYEALDQFVKFLRGCGYGLTNKSVGINEAVGHYCIEDSFLMNIVTFDQE